MKKLLFALITMFVITGCTDSDSTKEAPTFPSEIKKDNGKGDWRTAYYTDVRAEVGIGDTKVDIYEPQWPNYFFAHPFKAKAGETVAIRVGAGYSNFDAVTGVYGPQHADGSWGSLIAVNDDAPQGGTLDSYIELEVETDGNYLVLLKDYSWNAGEYVLSLECLGGACEEVVCPALRCAECAAGNVRDENGCFTCECSSSCPAAAHPPANVRCAAVVVWGKEPTTGECCQYPSPCMVPAGLHTFYSLDACEGPANEGEECSMYGRQCADDLECEYACPDGSNDPNCNLGINPTGVCAPTNGAGTACSMYGDQCGEGFECEYACPDGSNDPNCNLGVNPTGACVEIPAECQTDTDCFMTGCSGQVCSHQQVITTCEYRPEYMCYNAPTTSCGCNNGSCGWAQTAELETCLDGFGR